jgi:O-antigen ligase
VFKIIFKILREENPKIVPTPFDKFILLFLLAVLLSFIDSYNLINSIDRFSRYIRPVILFYVVVNSNFDKEKIRNLFITFFVGVGFSALYGLYQHYFLNIERISANMFTIEYAGIISITLIFALIYLLWSENKTWINILLTIYSVILILNLLFTQTRGAWLAFILSFIVVALIKNRKHLIYLLIIFLVIVSLSPFIVPDVYVDRFLSIFDIQNNRGNITRINLWKSSILIFKDHFINGVGLDSFEEVIDKDKYLIEPVVSQTSAHSNYFQLLAETGILGIFTFLLLYFNFIKVFYLYYKKSVILNKKLFYLAILGMIFSYLIHGGTEYILNDRFLGMVLWFLLALATSILTEKESA